MTYHRKINSPGFIFFWVILLGSALLCHFWTVSKQNHNVYQTLDHPATEPPPVPEETFAEAGKQVEEGWVTALPEVEEERVLDADGLPLSWTAGAYLPVPEALWQAGRRNGRVSGGGDPADLFGMANLSGEPVLHVRTPAEFPDALMPGQRAVLYLPGFEPGLYRVRVVTGGGKTDQHSAAMGYGGRRLAVRWNDRMIWRRWVHAAQGTATGVVPPMRVDAERNLLILENEGSEPLPLDTVWVERARRGEHPFYVAGERAVWLNRAESAWVGTAWLPLPVPEGSLNAGARAEHPPRTPPQSAAELQGRWPEVLERLRSLQAEGREDFPLLAPWHREIRRAVERGIFPAVELPAVRTEAQRAFLDMALWVYGDLVHTWSLHAGGQVPERTEQLQRRFPGVLILQHGGRGPGDVPAMRRQLTTGTHPWVLQNARSLLSSFERDAATVPAPAANYLHLRSIFQAFLGNRHIRSSTLIHASAAEYLMEAELPLVMRDTVAGGAFFPAGDGTPGLIWLHLRSLFRFGGPEYRKGHANVYGNDTFPDLANSYWAVADNGRDSVQVLLHASPRLRGRPVTLALPLPWSGPTRLAHHHVAGAFVDPVPVAAPESGFDSIVLTARALEGIAGAAGWLETEITLSGFHLLELSPAESRRPERSVQAPERVGFTELRETAELFRVQTLPPPPWWSRQRISANAPELNPFGVVEHQARVKTVPGTVRDREPMLRPGPVRELSVEGVTPLGSESAFFHFPPSDLELARVMRVGFYRNSLPSGETVGFWMRLHPAPGGTDRPRGSAPIRRASVHAGLLPERQRLDLELGVWYFVQSDAERWWNVDSHDNHLLFWPDPASPLRVQVELQALDLYQTPVAPGGSRPGPAAGFLRTERDGSLRLLIVSAPGTAAAWRQRLPYRIDLDSLHREPDADFPAEGLALRMAEDARILEVTVAKMPAGTSPELLARIRELFPEVAALLLEGALSAVLLETGF